MTISIYRNPTPESIMAALLRRSKLLKTLVFAGCFHLKNVKLSNLEYCRASNYWFAFGGKMSVYRVAQRSRRFVSGIDENSKEWLGFCRWYLSSLVFLDLMGSAKREINSHSKAIRYWLHSIITAPTVCRISIVVGGRHFWLHVLAGGPPHIL